VEIWFQDEARVGQKNGLVYQWARRGSRPRQPQDQRHASAYIFAAVCPARAEGAALVLPRADTEAMQLHLEEIGRTVAPDAYGVVVMDKASWHTPPALKVPANLSILYLPPYSPELNPQENIWQFLHHFPTDCSRPTRTSSTRAVKPGTPSSPKPAASPLSQPEPGPSSVTNSALWYERVLG
jgi:hypothetical protein